MTNINTSPTSQAAALPRPRHFLGKQPVVAVARYHSKSPCDWNILYHTVAEILEPFSGSEFLGFDLSEVDCSDWPLYDYDGEQIRRWFVEELERDGCFLIKWADRCGMNYREIDPLHIMRGSNTQVDENDQPIDCYWEVSVLNRDDAEFWHYLLSDSPAALDIYWEPDQDQFSDEVLDWVRKNPDRAEAWLNAAPSPAELVGESDDLDSLIKKIKRAIRQGRVPLD